ncbi:MAG: hypothetical protein NC212_08425 [Staphylococcus sp.]|nr:hypothetical protein [Staphylococcus sp.]
MNIFKRFYAFLRLREAVRKADNAHAKTGERYYVVPAGSADKNLLIMDRRNFRKLKQKRYITGRPLIRDLVAECFYCTPYANGSGTLHREALILKRRQYLSWYESQSKHK